MEKDEESLVKIPFTFTNKNLESFGSITEALSYEANIPQGKILCSLIEWYWRGDFEIKDKKMSRLTLLKNIHAIIPEDFIFLYGDKQTPRRKKKVLNGFEFDARPLLRVYGNDPKNWTVENCHKAFEVLSTESTWDGANVFPAYVSDILRTTLVSIEISEDQFQKFLKIEFHSKPISKYEREIKSIIKNFNGEKEYFDFKLRVTDNKTDIIHDILSLSNVSLVNFPNRYLIYGVDDSGEVKGVDSSSENFLKDNCIRDFLRGGKFNNIPNIEVGNFKINDKRIHFIAIKEDVQKKPYFLTAPYPSDKKEQRYISAGAIYTRYGSTNTPINRAVTSDQLNEIFKEKFGYNLPPIKRMENFIMIFNEWEKQVTGGQDVYHFRNFPEFKIEIDYDDPVNDNFQESWTQKFSDKKSSSYYVKLKYHSTILKRSLFVSCDGGRYFVPSPKHRMLNEKDEYIMYKNIDYKIWDLLNYCSNLGNIDTFLRISKIKLLEDIAIDL